MIVVDVDLNPPVRTLGCFFSLADSLSTVGLRSVRSAADNEFYICFVQYVDCRCVVHYVPGTVLDYG